MAARGRPAVKYLRVKRLMENRITGGEWAGGQIVPTEKELMQAFSVSRVTIRNAMEELEKENMVQRIRGKGTFVTLQKEISNQVSDGVAVVLPKKNEVEEDAHVRATMAGVQAGLENTGRAVRFCGLNPGQKIAGYLEEHPEVAWQWGGLITLESFLDAASMKVLKELGIPVVALGNPDPGISVSYVDIDNHAGGMMAVQHLLQMGWNNPIMIDDFAGNKYGKHRREGVEEALKEAGIDIDESRFLLNQKIKHGPAEANAKKLILDRVKNGKSFDSVIVFLEQATIGVYDGLKEAGLEIGRDVAVVHYNDYPWISAALKPAPTAIRQTFDKAGKDATQILLRQMEQGSLTIETRKLQPMLMIRESTGVRKV